MEVQIILTDNRRELWKWNKELKCGGEFQRNLLSVLRNRRFSSHFQPSKRRIEEGSRPKSANQWERDNKSLESSVLVDCRNRELRGKNRDSTASFMSSLTTKLWNGRLWIQWQNPFTSIFSFFFFFFSFVCVWKTNKFAGQIYYFDVFKKYLLHQIC